MEEDEWGMSCKKSEVHDRSVAKEMGLDEMREASRLGCWTNDSRRRRRRRGKREREGAIQCDSLLDRGDTIS